MTCNLLLWVIAPILVISASSENLETIYEWKYFNVTPVPPEQRTGEYNEATYFNYRLAVPVDVDQSKDGRVFVAVSAKLNVKVSLWTVSNNLVNGSPLLQPYPDNSWHLNKKDCSKIISSWSVAIDECNRLWVLDSGRINRSRVCPAKLMAFNLTDDTLIQSYVMPEEVYENSTNHKSALVNPVIRTDKLNCDNFTAFIADSEGYGLIVFDGTTFKRLKNEKFNPDERNHYDIFFIPGEQKFPLKGGIVPMDLEPEGQTLFFAPLASRAIYSHRVKDLLNGDTAGINDTKIAFDSQATNFRFSKRNILFAGVASSKIMCWNKKLNTQDVVAEDIQRLQFIAAMKIIPAESSKTGEEELLVLTNRIQKSINQNRNFDEINFRIMRGTVAQFLKNTTCNATA